jgi:hypothetical protein
MEATEEGEMFFVNVVLKDSEEDHKERALRRKEGLVKCLMPEKGYEVWLKRQEDKQRLRGRPTRSITEESTSCEKRGKAE